jgi:hypothetical protein
VYEWIVYSLSLFFHSIGHRVKTYRITPVGGNERGDIEIQDYVILPRGEDDRFPPRTLVMDVTMTHDLYGCTTQHTNGAFTHRVSSTGVPQSDGALNKSARMKIRHYTRIEKLVFWRENYLRKFRFLQASHFANLKESVGLILAKASVIRFTIPIDLSTWSFIPLPRFFNSRRVPPLLNQSLVLIPQQSP